MFFMDSISEVAVLICESYSSSSPPPSSTAFLDPLPLPSRHPSPPLFLTAAVGSVSAGSLLHYWSLLI